MREINAVFFTFQHCICYCLVRIVFESSYSVCTFICNHMDCVGGSVRSASWFGYCTPLTCCSSCDDINCAHITCICRWYANLRVVPSIWSGRIFVFGAGHLFRYVTNQPPKANSAFHPSGVGKSVNEYQLRLGRQRQV